jgi:hypothetical protein
MMLTEEEARKQVCPLIRYCANEADVIGGDASAIYHQQNCQASDCKIGWRWHLGRVYEPIQALRRGYCGAFGKPEMPE